MFWPLFLVILLADCATKRIAEERLPMYVPHEIVGEAVRFTLSYNPGAATGISFGPYSREILSILALAIIFALILYLRRVGPHDRSLAAALALVIGGALGNLLDRLRSDLGVVDFIDLGVGGFRFYTFNLADLGVTSGAVLLAIILWRREDILAEGAAQTTPALAMSDPEEWQRGEA